MVSQPTDIFGDLPDALINALLTRSEDVTERARKSVGDRIDERDILRERAVHQGLISKIDDLTVMPPKSVAAVDGAYVVNRLASFELTSGAALAVHGIGKLNEGSDIPYEFDTALTDLIRHDEEIARGWMFCMEYDVAARTEIDLIMLDGAFSTGMVAISLALRSASDLNDELSRKFKCRWTERTMDAVPQILAADNVIALPKRTNSNEFVTQSRLFGGKEVDTSGKSTASLILEAGEFAGPFRLETHSFYLERTVFQRGYLNELNQRYSQIHVVYFKPHDWSHALRIELPPSIAQDRQRINDTLETVRMQTVNPAMLEPYPLFVADRFAKSLGKGVAALLDAVRSEVIATSPRPEIAADMMNPYRSDPPREVTPP